MGVNTAETALPALVIEQRSGERYFVEIRPEHIGDVQLGVGQLPEQEVADALFAAGANQQVRINLPGSEELIGKLVLIDGTWLELTAGHTLRQQPSGAHQLPPAAVIGAYVEVNAGVMSGATSGISDQLLQPLGQLIQVTQKTDAHLLLVQGL